MANVCLHTYLQQTDLHALTAFETLTVVLGYERLVRLKRFQRFDIGLLDADVDSIESVLNQSYYILNPNKESYVLGAFVVPQVADDCAHFLVQIRRKEAIDSGGLVAKINQQFGCSWCEVSQSLIWSITVRKDSVDVDDVMQRVVMSSGLRRGGLLANPLYHVVDIIDSSC